MYVSFIDSDGETFYDGGLSNSRISYKDRVILFASAQNLADAVYLFFSSDYRVKLIFCGKLSKVYTLLVKERSLFFSTCCFLLTYSFFLFRTGVKQRLSLYAFIIVFLIEI